MFVSKDIKKASNQKNICIFNNAKNKTYYDNK